MNAAFCISWGCCTTVQSGHVYMAPWRSSSRCSRCFLLSCRTERKSFQWRTDDTESSQRTRISLTLSFLNSSYSGLSVGNSSRQSGQEFVYDYKNARDLIKEFPAVKMKICTIDVSVTFPSQGRIHPAWKRCLQGISRTVSCSSNSSKHTGHLRPLSARTEHQNKSCVNNPGQVCKSLFLQQIHISH